ncbi:MAG: hypothetical protein KAI24_10235 [Planctomycetes bacterium]|nr:hypothetical protein [Planctomycetota bacterium]
MDRFDYQLVLIAVVLGLAITELLTCVSHMLLARHRTRVFWVHLVWLVTVFFVAVQYWHVMWTWRTSGSLGESFFDYLLSLMIPVMLFVSAALIGPNVPADDDLFDFRAYYFANHRAIFACFALTLSTIIASNHVHLGIPLSHPVNLFRYGGVALLALLAISGNRLLHAIAALVLLAMVVVFALVLAGG